MKACVVGKAGVRMTDEKTGELIEGANLFFFAAKENVEGFFAGKVWVKKASRLYNKVMALDTSKPFFAVLEYDIQPGRVVRAVLSDIQVMDEDDYSLLLENPHWKEFCESFVFTAAR